MTNGIKIALIIAGGLIAATALYTYFSPYQTCVRAETAQLADSSDHPGQFARTFCARHE